MPRSALGCASFELLGKLLPEAAADAAAGTDAVAPEPVRTFLMMFRSVL